MISPKPQLIQLQIPATRTTIIPAEIGLLPAPAIRH